MDDIDRPIALANGLKDISLDVVAVEVWV